MAQFSSHDLMPDVIFKTGSSHTSIEIQINKDGLWEGIENIVVDKLQAGKYY